MRLFSNKDLLLLFLPALAEQALEYLIGMIDTLMAAQISEAAISGVSLVDFISALMISLFAALAAGGTIVVGQYLGRGNAQAAKAASHQLMKAALAAGILLTLFLVSVRPFILHILFGTIDEDVYAAASLYYDIIIWSVPFLALYNAGAGLFRSAGNARFPMKVMFYANLLHILGNALCLFMFHMGVEGVAIPSLLSRIGAALVLLYAASRPSFRFCLAGWLVGRADWMYIRQILAIGIPFSIENGLFQLGRIAVLSIVSLSGTAAIASNAVANILGIFISLPGMAITLALPVVISRCIGAGDIGQARYYTRKILRITHGSFIASAILVLAAMPLFLPVYHLSSEAESLTWTIMLLYSAVNVLIWPSAYILPVVFRSAGDARFPLAVSMTTMILCRIAMAYILSVTFGLGMLGTWYAMFLDWLAKAIIYIHHYVKGNWARHMVIQH